MFFQHRTGAFHGSDSLDFFVDGCTATASALFIAALELPLSALDARVRDRGDFGLRFYRAEPVPERWGSLDWPDNYFGGRWGPPYALLQGSLRPAG